MQVLIVIGLFGYWVYMKKVINLLIDVCVRFIFEVLM